MAPQGRLGHPPREQVYRHLHNSPFAAVVLTGGYVETGDTGRHLVEPGDVLFHQAFESHSHMIGQVGAEVLVVEMSEAPPISRGRVADVDAVVRLWENDPDIASSELLARTIPHDPQPLDWPDILARDLRCDPSTDLTRWAEAHAMHPGSISRGFRQVYSVTPAHYRLIQRTLRALSILPAADGTLAAVAADSGFADQSHMTRAIRRVTDRSALQIRRSSESVP